ncbi:Cycloeucalenol cycloisomerase [Rhypophila decipiens]|uniref:Cycloeucalenol cycloisomerase n=1 Tax=Rhypophila decipiens TaxID=261697 RepID=A0AAN6YB64_9PEZI|nr:Cycloeucalenol cycloisomerase [Rhypophila decipiens]
MPTKAQRPRLNPQPGNGQVEQDEYMDEKTRTHNLILLQSPLWILPVLYVMQTGILCAWSDIEYMAFSLAVASPSLVFPAIFLHSASSSDTSKIPYYLKLNLWTFVLVIFGTYFGTHYFFDLMGMEYTFGDACTWHLESDVLGQHGGNGTPRQVVPLFMYPLTHAYFMSYFCLLVTLEQKLRSVKFLKTTKLGNGLLLLGLSYGLAFAETYVMASPLLEDLFRYRDRERMLRLGSLGYAAYFVVGLPMVKRIDRDAEWGLGRVIIEALGTSMGIMVLLEAWAKVVGPI